ncbi:AAA family ATPase [Leptolyngbya boryana FACHB-1624]|nr:AAA family ATPase [Leptolyngbya sp. FACHB-1624]
MNDLIQLLRSQVQIVAIQAPATERHILLEQSLQSAKNGLCFWSRGTQHLQKVELLNGRLQFSTEYYDAIPNILWFILSHYEKGVFVIEGLLTLNQAGELDPAIIAKLIDTFYELRFHPNLELLLIDDVIHLPISLIPLIPTLRYPLPNPQVVNDLIQSVYSTLNDPEVLHRISRACLGLPLGELKIVLERHKGTCCTVEDWARSLLTYKVSKLQQRGLEFMAQPDVQPMGLDLLEAILDRDCALLSPDARKYGLSLPKGILLWGPPGTGKSLSAKYAAHKMGVPLLAANWGSLRSPKPGQSERNLDFLLEQCCVNAPVVLFFDDFDKGFAGWNSDTDGGIEGRLANKLLTWMQERIEPVYVVATCNRLEKLPPELIRRFDTIVFVDLPHAGARKDIFEVHLAKYFPTLPKFTESEWRKLLKMTHLCTPAEIALIVRKTAQEVFYQGRPGRCAIADLLEQRSLIVPAMIREEEAILAIRNRASFARPAASYDRSQWTLPEQKLFQVHEKISTDQ